METLIAMVFVGFAALCICIIVGYIIACHDQRNLEKDMQYRKELQIKGIDNDKPTQ